MRGKTSVVGLRLTDAELRKLDELAAQTYRPRSDIMRYLIAHARTAKACDLRLDPDTIPAAISLPEARQPVDA